MNKIGCWINALVVTRNPVASRVSGSPLRHAGQVDA